MKKLNLALIIAEEEQLKRELAEAEARRVPLYLPGPTGPYRLPKKEEQDGEVCFVLEMI